MADFRTRMDEMGGLADETESGTRTLDAMGAPPLANAGESIALLADAVARVAKTSAGISGELRMVAGEIRASRDEYRRVDESGANGMPKPP
ncbi:hypothetical protein A8924_1134 [Saccharopolyspora erythraea NRRL 2338]|nr:hypothetical protein [Saccharopolyspora erythraea]PFG93880.1 hypothetical protein A8924_1134 [Saccharopolyspora erythraea NRRL 2338]